VIVATPSVTPYCTASAMVLLTPAGPLDLRTR
jgi:hypothetical protein